MSNVAALPFGARMEELDKMRKRRKKMLKQANSLDVSAFGYFFNKKNTVRLPDKIVETITQR